MIWADPRTGPSELSRPLSIGVVAASPAGVLPEPEIVTRLDETRRLLEAMGHRTVDWAWPEDVDAVDCAQVIWAAEMALVIESRAAELGREPGPEELGLVVRWAWETVRGQSAVDVVRARARMVTIRRRMVQAMAGVDLLMLPVIAEPPIASGLLAELACQDIGAWEARAARFAPYTEVFNVTGQPAMSVPMYQGAGNLPLAIQFAGPVGSDRMLLSLARALEEARPWGGRRPVL